MLQAVIMMGGLGVIVGAGLALASKIFYVYVDPKVAAIDEVLPGANCGGCGLPGCSANAEAIAAGKASPSSCVAGGPDLAAAIAAILGVAVEAKEPDIARAGCYYGTDKADIKYIYDGLDDCRAAALLSGGMKVCRIGCLGLGTCVKACPFGALAIGPEGLPVVDEEKCTGCGTCERVCPKHIITLSSITRRIMREYTLEDCTTPCQRACPAGIDIKEYIRRIAIGDYGRAVQVIKERNPFPTVIGRICPRPCELECRRKQVDEPVAINFLKRFAADFERRNGRIQPYKAPATGRRVAVVGGGVAGLSAAFFAARLGHEVTVFEASGQAGGLLRQAIAKNRLPDEILDWDIAGVTEMGVDIQVGRALGRDFTIDTLLEEHETALLAAGGWDSRLARRGQAEDERPVPGICLMLDFLKETTPVAAGTDLLIAGGGRTAVEAALKAVSLGARTVTVLFREAPEELPLDAESLEALDEKGVAVRFGVALERFAGVGAELREVQVVDLENGAGESLPARMLVLASGRFPHLIVTPRKSADGEVEKAGGSLAWVASEPYKNPLNGIEVGMLSPGDPLTDFSAAIKAIGAGRRAAVSIQQALFDMPVALPEGVVGSNSPLQDVETVEGVATAPRRIMPVAGPRELLAGSELEKGFDEAAARAEAKRCLQCGLICYQHTEAVAPEKLVS